MKRLTSYLISLLTLISLLGCQQNIIDERHDLVIYSPHPMEFIEVIVREFEHEYNIQVTVVSAGTNQLINMINQNASLPADVLWGGSLSILQANQHLFEPFTSDNERYFMDEFVSLDGRITQFSVIPSVIMVNNNLIPLDSIQGYNDLLNPMYTGRIAFADPNLSSSSFEHIVNQLYAMGEGNPNEGWSYVREFVRQLNGQLLAGSKDVFEGVAEGRFAIGLTFEEVAARYVDQGYPITIIYPEEGTIVKADGISIVKHAPNMHHAKLFVNFITSYRIQRFMNSTLNRRSIRRDVPSTSILRPLDDIIIIEDDPFWSASNKTDILEYFNLLMRGD